MTRDETIKLMGYIKKNYPRFCANQSKEEKLKKVDTYRDVLSKYSYDDMIIVVDEYIRRGAVLYPEWMDIIKLYNDIIEKCKNWNWQPANPGTWELSEVKTLWETDPILRLVGDPEGYIDYLRKEREAL